jgi:hypothetical protein
LGGMRLEMGKYLHLDTTLAQRMTPGCTVPLIGFTVVARSGLDVRSKGTGAQSECSKHGHQRGGDEEEWLGGPGWPQDELVQWAGPKQFRFPLINVFSNLHLKLPAQKYII